MALSKKKSEGAKAEAGGFRPVLFAGGLGLLWFVIGPSGGFEDEASPMVIGGLAAARLAVDFVGGCVVVALLRLILGGARYALAWSRVRPESEAP